MSYVTTKPAWLAYTSQNGLGAVSLPTGFDVNNPLNWCGSCAAVQRMLADLGFYIGEFDGNFTGPVRSSFESFAKSKGLTTANGITVPVCTALRDAWLKQQGYGVSVQRFASKVAIKTPIRSISSSSSGGAAPAPAQEAPSQEAADPNIPIMDLPEIKPEVEPMCTNWWSCQTDTNKVLIIGGGVAGVAVISLVAYLALRK